MIHEAETEYQYARVIEYPSGKRTLELNEGQAEHSVCEAECDAGPAGPREPSSVLTGNYWDALLVDFFAARSTPPRRVAILGNAAGTTSRAYEEFFPRTRVDGVEIDPELSDDRPPLLRHEQPPAAPLPRGRAAVPASHRRALRRDSVDAYRQPYIPFYLTTKEFFESVRDRLAAGRRRPHERWPSGGPGWAREGAVGDRSARSSRTCCRDPIKDTNTVLIASRRAAVGRADEPGRAERCRSRCGRRPRPPPSGSSRRCAGATSTRTTGRRWSGWSTSPSSTTRAGSEPAGRRGDHRRRHRRLRRRRVPRRGRRERGGVRARGGWRPAASGRNSGSIQHPFDPVLAELHRETLDPLPRHGRGGDGELARRAC